MLQTKSLEALERLSGAQLHGFRQVIVQSHGNFIVIALPLYRHGDHSESRFEQTYGDTAVTLPEVHHGYASPVIGVVHTEVVLLLETGLNGQHPVQPVCRTARLKGPDDVLLGPDLRPA